MKATGRYVGGRPVENPGGLARSFHRKGEADIEIREFLLPPNERRQFTDDPCPTCLGAKYESMPDRSVRPCRDCIDEAGRRTGKRPADQWGAGGAR